MSRMATMTQKDIERDRRSILAARAAAQDTDNGVVGLYEFATVALRRWSPALDEVERLRRSIDAARVLLAKQDRNVDALHVLDCARSYPGYEPPSEKEIDGGWRP